MNLRIWVLLFLCTLASAANLRAEWLTDYAAALKKAAAEDKTVLINFTGSDWCGWCIKLKKEVFDTAEFKKFADENLVLLEIDFPRRKQLPAEQLTKNKQLAQRFRVKGYPTICLVDKNGRRLRETGYQPGGPAKYIAHLKQTPGFKTKAPAATPGKTQSAVPQPSSPAPVAVPPSTKKASASTRKQELPPAYAVVPPVIRYDDIALKGIMGSKTKLALINDVTLGTGEKGKIKVADNTVEVAMKEIRSDSVLVQIEGETQPRELKLNAELVQ